MPEVDAIVGQVLPVVATAVGAYGAGALTRMEGAAADATISLGERVLDWLLRHAQRCAPLQEAVTNLAADGQDPDAVAALRLQIHLIATERYIVAQVPHGLRYTAEELLAWALVSTVNNGGDETSWNTQWRSLAERLTDGGELRATVERLLAGRAGGVRLLVVDQFEGLVIDAPQIASRLDALLGALTGRG